MEWHNKRGSLKQSLSSPSESDAMSWLARSIANSLRLEDEDGEHNDAVSPIPSDPPSPSTSPPNLMDSQSQLHDEALSRGVKDDLTEFKQTLTRQFWGVASFLAPPPPHPRLDGDLPAPPDWKPSDPSNHSDPSISGDEEDEEYEDHPSDPVEVLKMRSNYDAFSKSGNLQGECYETVDWGDAVGITDEVLTFATNIAMHPETWIDFPIDEEEDNDAALRIELCPCHMSESYFWKVYFVLLHSRLNKHDAEILSTPQVAAARSMWMQELQKQTKPESYWGDRDTFELKDSSDVLQEDNSPMAFHDTHSGSTLPWTFTSEPSMSSVSSNYETEKYQMESSETQFIDKSVIVEKPLIKNGDKKSTVGSSSKLIVQNYEEESDNDWLEEDSELGGCNGTILPLENEEDISFSDLDDDDMVLPAKFKIASKE
ncbi:uncharacterized protein LOC101202841 isoform X2 [Cucumis sativus]|uniref:uncharacterized protein LOC101202841 isoform X2 n=1 Tax=Cucumis sativus TaxID=3659 RepID=UPI0012F4B310|nr:uncharacterized protein LOC101202841 isoform X2 [Cucumis sativus]